MGFPGGSVGKESACSAGDLGSISGLGRLPGGGHGGPLQYSCLENLRGQTSWVGYCPWGRKESDMTEQLSTAQHKIVNTEQVKEKPLLWEFIPQANLYWLGLQMESTVPGCGQIKFKPSIN